MKERLDVVLHVRGLFESREKARGAIMSGQVYVDGVRVDKPGAQIRPEAELEVRGNPCPYVSRGGWKLERALDVFGVDPGGFVCGDAGASTGGFTDCLLQRGARKVYAIDVGYGQLAWNLRNDKRVVCMERTNLRRMRPEDVGEALDLFTLDVSFISLKLVLPAVRAMLKPEGQVVCLIKPQFEAGKEQVGKKGVVRDPDIHRQVLERFMEDAASVGFFVSGLTFSPVQGPEGNIEFLGHLISTQTAARPDPAAVVKAAHETLKG